MGKRMIHSKLNTLSKILRAQELNDEAKAIDNLFNNFGEETDETLSAINWEQELNQKPFAGDIDPEEASFFGLSNSLLYELNKKPFTDTNTYDIKNIKKSLIDLGLKESGSGYFRIVYSLPSSEDFVLKISKSGESGIKMNKDEFYLQQEFSGLFPKVYAHSDSFSWIIIESANVIKFNSEINKFFPKIAAFIDQQNSDDSPLVTDIFSIFNRYDLLPIANLLHCTETEVKAVLKSDPLFLRLLKVSNKTGLSIDEIRQDNVGTSKITGEFMILDASIFDEPHKGLF